MLIEITGTSTRNKGAELMLVAIRQQLAEMNQDIELAVDPSFGSHRDRARYGLLHKLEIRRQGRSRLALALMPASFREAVGIVRDHQIDTVLDASGFAFGDQLPLQRSVRLAEQAEKWAGAGKPLVLLPQALGPFENPDHRAAFRRIADAARVVFAREAESFEHAKAAAGPNADIRMAPDFTNLVKPMLAPTPKSRHIACIVPNSRMLEKTENPERQDAYRTWLQNCVDVSFGLGLQPVVLPHGSDDDELVSSLVSSESNQPTVKRINDPIELKRFIGESGILFGSRFHALVSALSQGVPAFGTSWSHKYEQLYLDYGFPEMLFDVDIDSQEMQSLVHELAVTSRNGTVHSLEDRAKQLESRVRSMWDEAFRAIDLKDQLAV